MATLRDLITIDVKLTYLGDRLLLVHNNAILAYPENIEAAEEILSHPDSIFKLSKNRTDYRILAEELSEDFMNNHEFSY